MANLDAGYCPVHKDHKLDMKCTGLARQVGRFEMVIFIRISLVMGLRRAKRKPRSITGNSYLNA